jgi:hypothetical protein
MNSVPHILNWHFGWWLTLSGFVTGAWMGMYFHRENFLGGYNSFRRRIVRLGHIAQAALGMLNVLFALSPLPAQGTWQGGWASVCFIIGGVAMPTVCFLTGWKQQFRALFFIPVLSLMLAVIFTILGGNQ